MAKTKPTPAPEPAPTAEYTVVARRYRPQQFAELIGQEHVAQALVNALQSGRVAHAYLFTGARGVGKTSAARILAKALNCEKGPTATPCDRCESCRAIAEGQDVDVLEIDGASNRGIDEARDLRQNVGFRPTRGRYKIYIIDEVHMLTTQAFNALLKTLEEPPPHVKFILATTEVQKIPITILSRCQRFDFAHVGPAKILEQLKAIVKREGHEAEEEALRLVARRANGSMRDSQSLLDQLLASAQGKLTAGHVHAVLGTAGDERVTELAAAVIARDAKAALNLVGTWAERGLQVGELVDQLIEYWRALMLVSCAGKELRDLPVSPTQGETVAQQVRSLSLDTILTGLEVWTATKARMKGSGHAQVLLEMAVVRLCQLDDLLPVSQLIASLGQNGAAFQQPGGGGAAAAGSRGVAPTSVRPPEIGDPSKKNGWAGPNGSVNGSGNPGSVTTLPLTEATLADVWACLMSDLSERSPLLFNHLKLASSHAIFGPNALAIRFSTAYSDAYEACATDGNVERIQEALRVLTGQVVLVRFDRVAGPAPAPAANPTPPPSAAGRRKELMQLPLLRRAAEVFGAQLVADDPAFNPAARPAPGPKRADTEADADAPIPDPEES
jgi:DNA polymerase-3 subunit gamma/tau